MIEMAKPSSPRPSDTPNTISFPASPVSSPMSSAMSISDAISDAISGTTLTGTEGSGSKKRKARDYTTTTTTTTRREKKRDKIKEKEKKEKKEKKAKAKPLRPVKPVKKRQVQLRHTNNGVLINEENVLHISYSNVAHKDEGSSDLRGIFGQFRQILLDNREHHDPFCEPQEAQFVRKILMQEEDVKRLPRESWYHINRCFLKFLWLRLYCTSHLCYNEAQLRLWYDTRGRSKRTVILPCLLRQQVWEGAGNVKSNYWNWLIAVHPLIHFLSLDAERREAKRQKRAQEIQQHLVSASKVKAHYGNSPALYFSTASPIRPDWVDGLLQLPWQEYQYRVMERLLAEMRPWLLTDNSTRASGIVATDQDALNRSKNKKLRPAKPQRRGDEKDERARDKYHQRRHSKKYGAQTGTAHFRVDTALTLPFLGREARPIEIQKDCLLNEENILTNWIQAPMDWINPDKYLLPSVMSRKLALSSDQYNDSLFILENDHGGMQAVQTWSRFNETGKLSQLSQYVELEVESEADAARMQAAVMNALAEPHHGYAPSAPYGLSYEGNVASVSFGSNAPNGGQADSNQYSHDPDRYIQKDPYDLYPDGSEQKHISQHKDREAGGDLLQLPSLQSPLHPGLDSPSPSFFSSSLSSCSSSSSSSSSTLPPSLLSLGDFRLPTSETDLLRLD